MPKVKRILSENEAVFAQILTKARNKNMITSAQRKELYNLMKSSGLETAQKNLFILINPSTRPKETQA